MIIEIKDGGVFENGKQIGGIRSINNSHDFGGRRSSEMTLIFNDWIDGTSLMRLYQPSIKLNPKMETNYKEKIEEIVEDVDNE